jgi:hypothetical protein
MYLYTILLTLSGLSTGKANYAEKFKTTGFGLDRAVTTRPSFSTLLLPQAFKFGAGCMGFIKVWWAVLLRGAQ